LNALVQALNVFLPLGYLVATVLHGMAFAGERAPALASQRRALLPAVLVAHAGLFVVHARGMRVFPVHGTWLMISAIAFATALLFLLVARKNRQETVGAIVLLLVTALQAIASAFGPMQLVAETSPSGAFRVLHVLTSVIASAALLLSGIYGFLHIVLYRQLRQRTFGTLFRQLPDLAVLARVLRRSALAGFLFLTVGLNVGIGMAHAMKTEGFQYRDPQVLLTLALWIHFGVIAFSQRIRGLSARRASFAAAAGLVTLIAVLFLTLIPALTFHAQH